MRKLSDGGTHGQTDKSDFIGRCPTNVERPKIDSVITCYTEAKLIVGTTNKTKKVKSFYIINAH